MAAETQTKEKTEEKKKPEEKPKGVSVKDLATRYKMTPRQVRLNIRSLDIKARGEGGSGGTYDFPKNDPDLKRIEDRLKEVNAKAKEKEKEKQE